VTNITFIFETSPNRKPKEKKVGGHGILCPPSLKKWGDTSPVSPTKLRLWMWLSRMRPEFCFSETESYCICSLPSYILDTALFMYGTTSHWHEHDEDVKQGWPGQPFAQHTPIL